MSGTELFAQATYLSASVLFILGLRGLTSPEQARRGMYLAAGGMVLAILGTLVLHGLFNYQWLLVGVVIGSLIGAPMAIFMPMTAVPQRTALSHAFGALAVTLVGIAEFYTHGGQLSADFTRVNVAALGFEVMFGSLTITGSLMAFGKLQGLIESAPITYRFQNILNIALFFITLGLYFYLVLDPSAIPLFYSMIGLGLLFGILIVVPIGGADMPVVISLLNSYAGLAAAATGFALGNNMLIVAGALDGASGFILSLIMSRSMNRSFANVLFGAFGSRTQGGAADMAGRAVHPTTVEDAAIQLGYAKFVIFVPGYGMAVAQAQHKVAELADQLEARGVEVKYAIHPVAGRMPGHMNVLLAEANVPYAKLLDLDEINPEFDRADVAVVIGANDVVNPAAREKPGSPLYGMPILNADHARSVLVLKRSMNPGFAGIENDLFYKENTQMLFGDAKDSLSRLVNEVKKL
jgi:NAD(P) transhydrogenase subunit beta